MVSENDVIIFAKFGYQLRDFWTNTPSIFPDGLHGISAPSLENLRNSFFATSFGFRFLALRRFAEINACTTL
jgi:hypothetical protein